MSINTGNLSLFRFPVFFMLFSENPDYDIIGALSEVFSSFSANNAVHNTYT